MFKFRLPVIRFLLETVLPFRNVRIRDLNLILYTPMSFDFSLIN